MTDTPTIDRPKTLGGEEFPLTDIDAALMELRRPFTPEAIRWKVQATWPQPPQNALIVPYMDARLVYERLNLVVGGGWEAEYEDAPGGKFMWCRLTVLGHTRRDVGQEMMNMKGLISDAVKRAAVPFGIGSSLYVIPKMILGKNQGLREVSGGGGKKSLAFNFDGKAEGELRKRYAEWLGGHGIAAFGEPLSHGDTADAVGDVEAEEDGREAPGGASSGPSEYVTGEEADSLMKQIMERKGELHNMKGGRKRLPPGAFGLMLQEARTSIDGLKALLAEVDGHIEAMGEEEK